MQFFPSLDVNPGQAFSANSGSGYVEPKTDQDFSDVLSRQMDRHEPRAAEPAEPAPSGAQEPAEPAHREHASTGDDAARETGSEMAGDSARGHGEKTESAARPNEDREEPREKDAGREESSTHASRAASTDSATEAPNGTMEQSDTSKVKDAHAEEKEFQEALAALVRQAGEMEAADPEIAAGIAEIRELVLRFRESAPSERREQGALIASKMRALRERLFASRQGTESGNGQAAGAQMKSEAGLQAELRRKDALENASEHADAGAGRKEKGDEAASGSRAAAKAAGESGETRVTAENAEAISAKREEGAATRVRTEVPDGEAEAQGPQDATSKQHAESSENAGKTIPKAEARSEEKTPAGVREHAGSDVRQGAGASRSSETVASDEDSGAEEHKGRQAPRTEHEAASDVSRTRDGKTESGTVSVGVAGKAEVVRDIADPRQQRVAVPEGGGTDAQPEAAASAADGREGRNRQDAKQGFFSLRDDARQAPERTSAKESGGTSGKNVLMETSAQAAGTAQDPQSSVQQRLETPVSAKSAEVYRQVESGAFRNLGQGVRQLVIRLDPADLGQISVILQVKGKEVQAVLRASNQETSHALGEQMSQLRAHLESQGLKVSKLEVQTQLADSQEQAQWQGAEQHNRYQENRELALSAQRWRNMGRADSGLVRDVQTVLHREKLSQTGLDIFA